MNNQTSSATALPDNFSCLFIEAYPGMILVFIVIIYV
jgi:hypothetical protein